MYNHIVPPLYHMHWIISKLFVSSCLMMSFLNDLCLTILRLVSKLESNTAFSSVIFLIKTVNKIGTKKGF